MEFNIHNIVIMLWVEEFEELVHFIIINWFDCSGIHIYIPELELDYNG